MLTGGARSAARFRQESLMSARIFRLQAFAALMLGITAVHAQSQFEEDFDDAYKPWQEIAIQLPTAPKPKNLLPFHVSPTATQEFEIDASSIAVGADGVIRYVLVATSRAGAKNISYEGIRCKTDEKKLYAFGQPDGSWARSRRDRWESIQSNLSNRQHAALAYDYFCRNLTIEGDATDMVDRIRYQRPLNAPQLQ
jgi:hypothetical protein